MKGMTWLLGLLALAMTAVSARGEQLAVYCDRDAGPREKLAAREVYRYVYLRTGQSLPLVAAAALPDGAAGVVVARKDRAIVPTLDVELAAAITDLKPEQYLLRTVDLKGGTVVLAIGGDDVGTLYAAYRLAEQFGVRFYLHGDVAPEEKISFQLPRLNIIAKPLFDTRGIQPFHDFVEGPDWWNVDDYKAYLSQMAKMGMNFFGLHTYPEGGVGPEPAVWIGEQGDFDDKGRVTFSYPSSWANTARAMWGNKPMKTGQFVAGASLLFDRDDFGPDVMSGNCPIPASPAACNDVFNRTADLLGAAFNHAHTLGIKTCIGTETPLTVPKPLREKLKSEGKDPADPKVVHDLYVAMFQRIARAYPLDYYWLWTAEGWTWGNPKPEQVEHVMKDIQTAVQALADAKVPFTFATCGWVLGPPGDRAALHKMLPKECPMSCINRQVGHAPVEKAFADAKGRPLWAIPWMENDPDLTAPQLWVGRMRYDAADALRYGCTGLLGIHWRTKVIGPTIAALAQAGWSHPWAVAAPAVAETLGPDGGELARFAQRIAGTDEPVVYQTVRYNVNGYLLQVPNGSYTVTLKFCEPHYAEAGKRVFGVKLQGKGVIDSLDIFARVGKDKALDFTFKDVAVANDRLHVEFVHQTEYPAIAGIVIQGTAAQGGKEFVRKINCGGPAWKDYEADDKQTLHSAADRRTVACDDFWKDWATAHFGAGAADAVAKVFLKIDGRGLPESSAWLGGPGGVRVNGAPWEQEKEKYAFVDELESLRASIKGAGNLDRFDYWLNTFCYMRTQAHIGCVAGKLNGAMVRAMKEKNAESQRKIVKEEALPLRIELASLWKTLIEYQLAATDTPGEMGTLANLEMHSRAHDRILDKHDAEIVKILGEPLPAAVALSAEYAGMRRIIVPTVRSSVAAGESLGLKVIVLDNKPAAQLMLHWRPLGKGDFAQIPAGHVARGVYQAAVPAEAADVLAIEYYLTATLADGAALTWPAGAPASSQSVVITP